MRRHARTTIRSPHPHATPGLPRLRAPRRTSASPALRELALLDPADAEGAAAAAGLRYVSDERPGYRRRKRGNGWSYLDLDGKAIADARVRARIDPLVIPPAWTDVWICPLPNGHIQASGRDARGRKQYRYHQRWREVRDATKFSRLIEFGSALPRIRRRVRRDLARRGLPREKVLATVVCLLETTCIRVGNEEYRRDNASYGLTTMRTRHVSVRGASVEFHFDGKGGKAHHIELVDSRLARIVRRCQEIPGYELFQYVDVDGTACSIDSGDVNDYLHEIVPEARYTAKDFRTWMGTLHALVALRDGGPMAESATGLQKQIVGAVDRVAQQLCNTRAVCRQFYIHPSLLTAFEAGAFFERLSADPPDGPAELKRDERVLLEWLRAELAG